MIERRYSLRLVLLAVFCGSLFSASAWAQNPQTTVLQMNQKAMNAYGSLKIAESLQVLKAAEAMCNQYGLRGQPLARTYANLGLVEGGGNQNNAAAMDYFKRAVCLDPSIALDPLNSTPDVETLFNMSRAQARAPDACAGVGSGGLVPPPPPPSGPGAGSGSVPPPPQPAEVSTELLRHAPIGQQLRLVPIPLFVEVNPNITPGQVILFYRTMGERIFQQLPMAPRAGGYGATIGCDVLQTFDPAGIEYYIAVLDENNQLLGTAGSEAQPNVVTVVSSLSVSPPALPDAAPPIKCEEECPPWNPDCNSTCKQMGDLCDNSSECCEGMACVNEACEAGSGSASHVRIFLNAGTGFGLITSGEVDADDQVAPGALELPKGGSALAKLHARIGVMVNLTPDLLIGASFRADLPLDPNEDPLRPAGLLNLSYRLVGNDSSVFELWSMFGVGAGVFQHRVAYNDCILRSYSAEGVPECDPTAMVTDSNGNQVWDGATDAEEKTFFRESGLLIVEAGLDSYIWFGDHFGLNIGLIVDAMLPVKYEFALNFDLQAGFAFRF